MAWGSRPIAVSVVASSEGGDPILRIDQFQQYEENNYRVSIIHLGSTFDLTDELLAIYAFLGELIGSYQGPPSESMLAGVTFLQDCEYLLHTSVLTLLRGHLSDSFRVVRRAIESSASAHRMAQDSATIGLWLYAQRSDANNKRYKAAFSVKSLFPKDHQLLTDLYQSYDICSKQMHSRLESFATRTTTTIDGGQEWIGIEYFDVGAHSPGEPARTFLWTIKTYLQILLVFEEVFVEVMQKDRATWEAKIRHVETQYDEHHACWKETIK